MSILPEQEKWNLHLKSINNPEINTRRDIDIREVYNDIPNYYTLYYAKNVKTSQLSSCYSLLNFPQTFHYAKILVDVLGEDYCKNYIKLMIEGAEKFHMGYQKKEYENYVNFSKLNKEQKRFFDWVKTYTFIRRYSKFLSNTDRYIHPILFSDNDVKANFPRIHPGTARIRCAEYLFKSQNKETYLDIIYYNKFDEKLSYLAKELNTEWKKVNSFDDYLQIYGYSSYSDYYSGKKKLIQYDPVSKIEYPEYIHFLKREQYIPFLYEALYHLFEN